METCLQEEGYTDMSQFLSVTIAEGDSDALNFNSDKYESSGANFDPSKFYGFASGETSLTKLVPEIDNLFSSKQTFSSIFNRFGPQNGRLCPYCHQYFSKGKFFTHILTHTGEKPFLCEICGKGFRRTDKLNSHMRLHNKSVSIEKERKEVSKSGKLQKVCPYCSASFSGQYKLSRHIRTHTGFKPYQCCCGARFTRTEHLKKHQEGKDCDSYVEISENSNLIIEDTVVKTLQCSAKKTLKSKQMKFDKGFDCEFCGKNFLKCHKLNIHRRIHTGERPYQCDTCGKTFSRKDHLIKHKNIHLKYRKVSQLEQVTTPSLNVETTPLQHMDSNDTTYECHICGHTTKKLYNLQMHMETHGQRDLYKCQICLREFKVKKNFEAHLLNHDSDDTADILPNLENARAKRCQCPICHKWLVSKSGLAIHIRSHTGEKPNPCDLCDKYFVRKADMMRHRRTHTGENMFVCEQCDASYTRRDKLAQHIRKSHMDFHVQ